MSKAFTPPDTLSPDDVRTVADIRRALWINGMFGMGAGTVTGMTGHLILQTLQNKYIGEASSTSATAAGKSKYEGTLIHKCLRPLPPLGRNTFMLCLLGGGALGSFVLSTTAGKNAVHLLHPIFNLGKTENAGKSPYQIAISKSAEQTDIIDTTNPNGGDEDLLDAAHHRTRSIRRKESMKSRLETGNSLANTHSNNWPHDASVETDEMQKDKAIDRAHAWGRRQTNRRKVVQDRIENGKALSDSTGGHWAEDKHDIVELQDDFIRDEE